jgi:hypothetical protein
MSSNKGRTYAYRNEVLLALIGAGFVSATRPAELRTEPDRSRHGDICGVTAGGYPVTIAVRNQRDLALAEAAEEVKAEAKAEGSDVYVSVHSRRGRPVEESYCVLPLSVLLRLLQRLNGTVA